jgi:tetrahydromethanopterin S-methyltransferase subunit G
MNSDQFEDLKQFITATVSQQAADLATKDDIKNLHTRMDKADTKIDEALELLEGISDVVSDDHHERLGMTVEFNQLKRRLETLERKFTSTGA